MSLAATLARGREAATARMLDTVELGYPTGGTRYDHAAQAEVETYEPLLTTRCRVRVRGALGESETEVGGRVAAEIVSELDIPWDSPPVPAGTVGVITAVDQTSDPTLLHTRLRVEGAAPGSQTTARRLRVSEVLT